MLHTTQKSCARAGAAREEDLAFVFDPAAS
jgi:hypothetical protein